MSHPPEFLLLETLLWEPSTGWFLLDYHLQRLQHSASELGFLYDGKIVTDTLAHTAESLSSPTRGRLLLHPNSDVRVQTAEAGPTGQQMFLAIAPSPVDSADLLLRHKTTQRALYNQFRAERPDADDVILWNERNELTETCIGNLCVRFGNRWFTPDLTSGLLPGTYRQFLIEEGTIEPKRLPLQALYDADEVVFINSVRKWCSAVVID